MRFRFPWPVIATMLTVGLLPMKSGCAPKTACVKARAGMCPTTAEATAFFTNACDGINPVQSVDGEATFDGEFCCYPVTEVSSDFSDVGGFECGVGGFVGDTGGFNPTTTATSTTGVGAFGGGGGLGFPDGGVVGDGGEPCLSCAEVLANPDLAPEACDFAQQPLGALIMCACSDTCAPECSIGGTCDATGFSAVDCQGCFKSNCSLEVSNCEND